MKIEDIEVKKIKPYPNNPRINDEAIKPVAESIKEFGFQQPIVVDKDMVVIAGHTRLKAAEKLGLETVPVLIARELSDEQVRAYRLADNKTNELSLWDFELLDEELEGIDEIDMEEFGFEIEKKINGEAIKAGYEEFQENRKREIKPGDVYQLGDHRLMCGDATIESNLNKLIDDNPIDLLFTDPPYGISIVKKGGTIGNGKSYKPFNGDETTETAKAALGMCIPIAEKSVIWGGELLCRFSPVQRRVVHMGQTMRRNEERLRGRRNGMVQLPHSGKNL